MGRAKCSWVRPVHRLVFVVVLICQTQGLTTDEVISHQSLSEASISHQSLNDHSISQEGLSDKSTTHQNSSDESNSQQSLSDEANSQQSLSDETNSQQSLSDETNSQQSLSDALPCPSQCSCKEKSLQEVLGKYNEKHSVLRGEDYRSENRSNAPENYTDSFGLISQTFMNDVIEINCVVDDKIEHSLFELLNGTHLSHYTSLEVTCANNEDIVWDIPAWVTTFNIFVNEQCNIRGQNHTPIIQLPQNLWVIESYGSKTFHTDVALNHAMNMIALIIAESPAESYPQLKVHLQHVQMISYHSNDLKEFDCQNLSIMVHLDTLNLGGNELTHFPECIVDSNTMSVTYVSLAHNLISDISALFKNESADISTMAVRKDPDIEILDLSYNKITDLELFIEMSTLTTLDLSHNLISKVNMRSFKNIPKLAWLSLQHNLIHVLHEQVFRPNLFLKEIDLSKNEIENVQASMLPENISKLELDVRYNKLRYPLLFNCMEKSDIKGSVSVYGSGNPYNCDCKALAFEKCVNKLKLAGQLDDGIRDMNEFQCYFPRENKAMKQAELSLQSKCVMEDGCPSACSCHMVNEKTVIVNCSSRHLMELPDVVPDVSDDQQIVMLLNHNPIQLLGYRPYLHQISELYIHNCLLSAITTSAMDGLKGVKVLALHKNLLKRLPQNTQNMSMAGLKNLTLHGNRWACDCSHLWMTKWLRNHGAALWAPAKVQCAQTKIPVTSLSESDVQCGDTDYVDMILVACMLASTIISTLYVFYYYRREINQLLYIRLGLRLWDAFTYGDIYSVYDAFVFYSQNNYKWVVDTLSDTLEGGTTRYKLCLHFRDFPKDEVAVDNIPLAISLSRCSLLLLSRDFLENEWLIPELRAAFQRYLFGTDSLIIIVTEDLQPNELTPDLRAYMAKHETLHIKEDNFWQKLEYFLPPPRFLNDEAAADPANCGKASGEHTPNKICSQATCDGFSDFLDASQENEPRDTLDADDAGEKADTVGITENPDVRCQGDAVK